MTKKSEKRPDNWMPLYVGDYLRDTSRLTTEQHGAYLLLIMDYWVNGPLPDDDAALAAIVKMTPAGWKKARTALSGYFEIDGGHWFQGRVEREIAKANSIMEQRKDAGRKSAEIRWGKGKKPKVTGAVTAEVTDKVTGEITTVITAPVTKPVANRQRENTPLPPPKTLTTEERNLKDHSLGLAGDPARPAEPDPAAAVGKPRVIAGGKP
jgi:uncharacterized protein YdaU (DUF1376 family)